MRMLPNDGGGAQSAAESTGRLLDLCLQRSVVGALLRQTDNDEPCADVALMLVQPGKMDRTMKRLSDDGYVDGPAPSHEMLVRDGQTFGVRFRGNICCDDGRTVRRATRECVSYVHVTMGKCQKMSK